MRRSKLVVPAKDYHKILGLRKRASKKEIREAYRRLALQFHPDRNHDEGAEERFKEISEAYAILSGKQAVPAPVSPPHGGTGAGSSGSEVMDWSAEIMRIWEEIRSRRNDNMYR